MVKVKRIYDKASDSDGYRILVDRLWPRGISKADAAFNLWVKEIAPSDELRKWFAHDPEKWGQFKKKYQEELAGKGEAVEKLKEIIRAHKSVTLVYAAKDEAHNNAVALREFLSK